MLKKRILFLLFILPASFILLACQPKVVAPPSPGPLKTSLIPESPRQKLEKRNIEYNPEDFLESVRKVLIDQVAF